MLIFNDRFASSLVLFSTSCLSVTPSLAETVNGRDWLTVDSWKYQHVDLWLNRVLGESKRKVLSLSPDGTVMQVNEIGGAVFQETVRADGWTTRPLPPVPSGVGIYEYAFLTFPLDIGKTWDVVSYRYSQAAPLLIRISWTCGVEGNEDVVVPAGSFKSVRVRCDGWWVDRGWIGKEVQTLWFAPAVRGVVLNRYAEHTSGGKVWNKWESSLLEFRPGK